MLSSPYCYLIGWSSQKKYYYGVRFAKGCSPSDLWNSYFTSSKYVKECRELYGEPDIVQVRKTFDSSEAALLWESKVLKRLKASTNDMWLNLNIQGAIKWTDEMKEAARQRRLGWVHSNEVRNKIGDKMKGRDITWGEKISEANNKGFKIKSNIGEWTFKNTKDCLDTLGISYTVLFAVKKAPFTFNRIQKRAKHPFKTGDTLTFEKL